MLDDIFKRYNDWLSLSNSEIVRTKNLALTGVFGAIQLIRNHIKYDESVQVLKSIMHEKIKDPLFHDILAAILKGEIYVLHHKCKLKTTLYSISKKHNFNQFLKHLYQTRYNLKMNQNINDAVEMFDYKKVERKIVLLHKIDIQERQNIMHAIFINSKNLPHYTP